MANPLLDRASPAEFAERRQALEIKAKLKDFAALAAVIESDLSTLPAADRPGDWPERAVQIELRFHWADVAKSLPALAGRVETVVTAVCQRCLEAFDLPLVVDLDLLLVQSADGEHAGSAEVWELEDDTVRPLDVVQESLIMALPLSAMHVNDDCVTEAATVTRNEEATLRPFAGLRARLAENED